MQIFSENSKKIIFLSAYLPTSTLRCRRCNITSPFNKYSHFRPNLIKKPKTKSVVLWPTLHIWYTKATSNYQFKVDQPTIKKITKSNTLSTLMAYQVNIISQLNQTTTASQALHMIIIAELRQCPVANRTAFWMMIEANVTPKKRRKPLLLRDHYQKNMFHLLNVS